MTPPPSDSSENHSNLMRRRFILSATLLLLGLFLYMLSSLLVGVVLGIMLWSFTDGLFRRLERKLKGKRGSAAGLTLLITVLIVIVPLTLLLILMAADASTLADSAQEWFEPHRPQIESMLNKLSHGKSIVVFGYELSMKELTTRIESYAGNIGQFLIGLLQNAVGSLARGALLLGVTLYTLFFFYLDGNRFLDELKRMLPLRREQSERFLNDFFATSRASLKTVGVIGLLQGALGGLAFWVCGIPAPFFFTLLMTIASVIPAVGAHIILVPAALLLILAGKVWYGVGMLIWSLVVIANIDNILRPKLVKHDVDMHELLVFLSTIGGLATFGFFGVILGPVIAALLKVSLQVFGEVYHESEPTA